MINKPLVSICIPTYNRDEYLEKTIESIIRCSEFMAGYVELVVSDNASTDKTEEVCKRYIGKYNNFYYHRNEKNVVDGNFYIVIKEAHGLLRKLWNDTMIVTESGLSFLCRIVEKYKETKPVLFFDNGKLRWYQKEYSKIMNFEELIRKASYSLTWIGAYAVWEDDIKKLTNDGMNLHLWQTYQLCRELDEKRRGVFLIHRFAEFNTPRKKDVSYGYYRVFYENYLIKIIRPYVDNGLISKKTWSELRKDLLYNFFTTALLQWDRWKKGNESMQFSKTEDLKLQILKEYQNECYWLDYSRYYYLQELKADSKKIKYESYKVIYKLSKLKTIFGR